MSKRRAAYALKPILRQPRPRRPRGLRWAYLALVVAGALVLATEGFSRWPPFTQTAGATRNEAGRAAPALTGFARVIDGDTLDLDGERIRLWGIDAPERAQRCDAGAPGRRPAQALSRAISGQQVSCTPVDHDSYGRTVARCTAGGLDLGQRLVAEGWAWDYAHYSGGAYRAAESAARAQHRGVWRMHCAPAWQWRHAQG